MLAGKTVLLCVSGSIAAYKIAYLASALKKLKADVHVLMTRNATNFINPITFETLTGNKCLVDTFDRNFEFSVEAGPWSCGRYVDDHGSRMYLQEDHQPGDEYENVRESDHTG